MNFNQAVYKIILQVPRSKVATYGQIAAMIGSPRAARQIGWALHQLPVDSDVPWQRIINHQGMISTTCEENTLPICKNNCLKKKKYLSEKSTINTI